MKEKEYVQKINEILMEEGVTNNTIKFVMEGINIDNGEILFQWINEYNEKDQKELINNLTKYEAFYQNLNGNTVIFLCAWMAYLTKQKNNVKLIWQFIIKKLVYMAKNNEDRNQLLDGVEEKVCKYFFEVMNETNLPDLQILQCKEDDINAFVSFMKKVTESECYNNSSNKEKWDRAIRKWFLTWKKGKEQDVESAVKKSSEKEEIERKKNVKYIAKVKKESDLSKNEIKNDEEKKRRKRAEELKKLATYYEELEKEFETKDNKIFTLEVEIEQKNKEIAKLKDEKAELYRTKTDNAKTIASLKSMNDGLQKRLDESLQLNRSFDTFKEQSEVGMLKDIANALKDEYEDFMESIDDKMDDMLGEIYREKMKSIFKILKNKGINIGE